MTTYQIISLVLSTLSIIGIGSAFNLFWKDTHDKKIQNSEKTREAKKKERQEEIKELLNESLSPIKETQERIKSSIALIEDGTKCTLRDRLLAQYKICARQKYRTTEETQNWEKMFDAYHQLKGNSFVDDLKIQFENIDTYEEYLLKKEKLKEGRNNK